MNYKELMLGFIKNINEVASEIASSSYGKSIYPGKTELIKELNETMSMNPFMKKDELQTQMLKVFQKGKISDDLANDMASTINPKSFNDDLEKLKEQMSEGTFKKAKEKAASVMDNPLDPDELNKLSSLNKAIHYPKAYFTNPDKTISSNRIATAALGYTGVAVGARYLSGGTLTTDSYGRKDIAGVPFL